jgi:hypothetical protein
MSPCDRFEREGLLQLERGLPLDDHHATCADCGAARALYERLRSRLGPSAAPLEPPAGWREAVWAAVSKEKAGPTKEVPRRRWLMPAALTAAAAVVVAIWPRGGVDAPGLEVMVLSGTVSRRSLQAQPGDTLTLRARPGGRPQAELRVYFNDKRLVLRCSTAAPCERTRDALLARLVVGERGAYQTLLLTSSKPLPEPGGDLDADSGAALETGADVVLGQEIQVR